MPLRKSGSYSWMKSYPDYSGRSRLYRIWAGMRKRCEGRDPTNHSKYAGRGILVCQEWSNSYKKFLEWALSNGYEETMSLDRIDNNGMYCPENCRWATSFQQAQNKRNVKVYDICGLTGTVSEWSLVTGIKKSTIKERIRLRGMSPYQAVTYKDIGGKNGGA